LFDLEERRALWALFYSPAPDPAHSLTTTPPSTPPKKTKTQPTNSTVADGTCQFPSNMFGCESAAKGITGGGVKFLAEDRALECEGKDTGKCASRATFTAN
jgi:hypothetical protein